MPPSRSRPTRVASDRARPVRSFPMRTWGLLGVPLALAACGGGVGHGPSPPPGPPPPAFQPPVGTEVPPPPPSPCSSGAPMRVHFYDAGQALAALVMLPDGRRVLVDAGESPT